MLRYNIDTNVLCLALAERLTVTTLTSKDGTAIVFDRTGQGPAVILVVGAFNDRATGAPLAQALEQHFTVYNYDRRGRGESGDTPPYAVDREIEDLESLIDEAGGAAYVFGYSSGAILALKAAAHGLPITKLALYEPPPTGAHAGALAAELAQLIETERRGDAVECFQIKGVGIPAEVVASMRNAPFRPALERIAHTLVYEMTILDDATNPPTGIDTIRVPTLIMDGEHTTTVMHQMAETLANALPNGQHRMLEGQSHDIVPAVLAPVLETFFTATTAAR